MTHNDEYSGEMTISVLLERLGKPADEVTITSAWAALPEDVRKHLEQYGTLGSVMSEEEMWRGQSPGLDVANPPVDNIPLSPSPVSDADLRAVHDHLAERCSLCGQLIPGNIEGATDDVS